MTELSRYSPVAIPVCNDVLFRTCKAHQACNEMSAVSKKLQQATKVNHTMDKIRVHDVFYIVTDTLYTPSPLSPFGHPSCHTTPPSNERCPKVFGRIGPAQVVNIEWNLQHTGYPGTCSTVPSVLNISSTIIKIIRSVF